MMGRRILRDRLPQTMHGPNGAAYLANIGNDIWRALRDTVPFSLRGEDFLRQFSTHEDDATTIDPDKTYAVRLATEHPIYEAARTQRFAHLLQSAPRQPTRPPRTVGIVRRTS
ncbi:hypothetical protein FM036_43710, partial [Nostoc sp. HG1]|nr:hypothetical protein [Nostoc sp. HG1]